MFNCYKALELLQGIETLKATHWSSFGCFPVKNSHDLPLLPIIFYLQQEYHFWEIAAKPKSCCKVLQHLQYVMAMLQEVFPAEIFCKMLTITVFYWFAANTAFLTGCCKALKLLQGAEIFKGVSGGSYDNPGQISSSSEDSFWSYSHLQQNRSLFAAFCSNLLIFEWQPLKNQ